MRTWVLVTLAGLGAWCAAPVHALDGSGLRVMPGGGGPAWPSDGQAEAARLVPGEALTTDASVRTRWTTVSARTGRGLHSFSVGPQPSYGLAWQAVGRGDGAGLRWRYGYDAPGWRLGDGQRWNLLWRVGMGHRPQGQSEHYMAVGLAATGWWSWRPQDRLDVRVYQAQGHALASGAPTWLGDARSRERGLALSYDASITPGLHLVADLQWSPPAISLAPEGAIWFGLRAQFRF